uniref:Galectin n=1 Tax=Haemonchus contortus TaxID=6289 RepID=A0A7I4YFI8_HAECO
MFPVGKAMFDAILPFRFQEDRTWKFGGATSSSIEAFNINTPNHIMVPDFNNGRRFRVVVVPLPEGDRFAINLRTPSDIAMHFNPRFNEDTVVFNSTSGDNWQKEERVSLPLHQGRVYTIEFVGLDNRIQTLINGVLFHEFNERIPCNEIRSIGMEGAVHIHSVIYV